jgi:hypothetical protein
MGARQSQPKIEPPKPGFSSKTLIAKEQRLWLYNSTNLQPLISAHIFSINETEQENKKIIQVHYLHKNRHYTVIYDDKLNYVTEKEYDNIFAGINPHHLFTLNDFIIYQYPKSLRLFHTERNDGMSLLFHGVWYFTFDHDQNLIVVDDFDNRGGVAFRLSIYLAEHRYRNNKSQQYVIPYNYKPHYNMLFAYILDMQIIRHYLKNPRFCILHTRQHNENYYVIYIDSDTYNNGKWEQNDVIVDKWYCKGSWIREEFIRMKDVTDYHMINLLLGKKTVHFNNGMYGISSVLDVECMEGRGRVLEHLKSVGCLDKMAVSLLGIIADYMALPFVL